MESYPLTMPCAPEDVSKGLPALPPSLPDPGDAEHRIAEWIVSTLNGSPPPATQGRPHAHGNAPIDVGHRRSTARVPVPMEEGWQRFRATESRGITVVVLNDRTILGDHLIKEIEGELRDLVVAGSSCIVLDFDLVERCSSQFLAVVAKLFQRCRSDGGLLKVCGLRPDLAGLFTLPGLGRAIPVAPDAPTAVAGAWPERPPATLPVAILSALKGSTGQAPKGPGRRDDPHTGTPGPVATQATGAKGDPHSPAPASSRIRLVVLTGQAKGREITIPVTRFVIGRHPSCQLRPRSPTVSRFHTILEARDGRVFVRDLGGANGTGVDDRTLHGETTEVVDNTRLRIGPLQFVIRIEADRPARTNGFDNLVARWLLEGDDDDYDPCAATMLEGVTPDILAPAAVPSSASSSATAKPLSLDRHAYEGEIGSGDMKCEVIQGVLVLTVMMPTLFDESAVGQLRDTLARLYEQTTYRRIVISLCNVAFLSSAAVGVLVAHMLRLEWAGGGLRLCHILPPVMAILKKIHLPMLVEIYPTLEEAVLTA